MKRIILGLALFITCMWGFTAPAGAVIRKPENPVHERRMEEYDKHKEVYGVMKTKMTAQEKEDERERIEAEKKAAKAMKAEAERKKQEESRLKMSSADTLDIVPEEEGAAGEKNKIESNAKKTSGPKVITIKPQIESQIEPQIEPQKEPVESQEKKEGI